MKPEKNQLSEKSSNKNITRKEAIKKVGATALSVTSLVFLETKANACVSPTPTNTTITTHRRKRWWWRRRSWS